MFSGDLVFFQLHEPALFAHVNVQRIVSLAAVQLLPKDRFRTAETCPGQQTSGAGLHRKNGRMALRCSV